jgi:endogenous inhibitor of DNA gyrase (YacG/DUF329 family)
VQKGIGVVSSQEGQVKKGNAETCRYCGHRLVADDPQHKRFWPFCSERCKMAELGLWFEGRYVISREQDEVADDAGAAEPKPPAARKSDENLNSA